MGETWERRVGKWERERLDLKSEDRRFGAESVGLQSDLEDVESHRESREIALRKEMERLNEELKGVHA